MALPTLACIQVAAASAAAAPTTTTSSSTAAAPSAPTALLSPSYIVEAGPGVKASTHGDLLAVLALTGLANRAAPTLWLNSTATGWVNGVPVMWSYPQADTTWLAYLEKEKGIGFERAKDAQLCTLLGNKAVAAGVKGLVMYEDAVVIDALKWAAVSAAGIHDGLPVTAAMVQQHSCLQGLPVVFTVPAAETFAGSDLAVYQWMIEVLLPASSTKTLVGACHNWANYTCGGGDP
eukprot:SAG22_NODE_7064_length_780_cov_1.099853_1_plen_233_part_10